MNFWACGEVQTSAEPARTHVRMIRSIVTRDWKIKKVYGGWTHRRVKKWHPGHSATTDILHGPCCPVCVKPVHLINDAITFAEDNPIILGTFGVCVQILRSA